MGAIGDARFTGADSPEERVRFHQEHSGPLMNTFHDRIEAQLAERKG